MKKYLFFLIISISFLKADGYYMGKCVHSIESIDSTNTFTVNFSGNWTPLQTSNTTVFKDILPTLGLFEYDPLYAICKSKTSTDTTTNETIYKYGLTEIQFNFLSGLTGLLTAILLVFVIYKKV